MRTAVARGVGSMMARILIVGFLTVLLIQPLGTVEAGPAELDQIALHQRLLEAINRGDVTEAMALFTDDAVFQGGRGCDRHPAAMCLGKEEIRRDIEARVRAHTRLSNINIRFFHTTWTTWTTALFEMQADFVQAAGVDRILVATTMTVQGNKIHSLQIRSTSRDEQTAKYISAESRGTGGYPPVSLTDVIPYGRLVDVGGRRLYIECQGRGSPAVVIEAGIGGALGSGASSKIWNGREPRATIQPDVARVTRVCTYDRAGVGRSDPAPPSALLKVVDLHTLLSLAGVQPPYVLVGYAFGGFLVHLYADMQPDDVAGIVMIDPNTPAFPAGDRVFSLLPPEIAEQDREARRRSFAETSRFEPIDYSVISGYVRLAAPPRDVPMVVLTLGMGTNPYDFAPYWTLDLIAKREQLRQEAADNVAHQVPHGIHVFVDTSNHDEFWFMAPQRVTAAITQVVQAARGLRVRPQGPDHER
jgi:pimeloyl-ACP methyl ester carboxylesterase